MVAIDLSAPAASRDAPSWLASFLRVAAVLAALTALTEAAKFVEDSQGWAVAADALWRAEIELFAIAFGASAVARLLPETADRTTGRDAWTFVALFGFGFLLYLGFVLAPYRLTPQPHPIPLATSIYTLLTGSAALIAIGTAAPWPLFSSLRRGAQSVALGTFWSIFALSDLDHLYGPHRPDPFFGITLLCLLSGLFVRFGTTLAERLRPA